MIKCEFWTSEQILSCSPLARLLFIGFWNFADDNGVHQASYVRLRVEVFPADDFTNEDIKKLINELIFNKLLMEYSVNGELYWRVTGWEKHQRIDRPSTPRHPLPESGVQERLELPHRKVEDESKSTQRALALKEKEKKVKENNLIGEVKTSPASSKNSIFTQKIFQYWQQVMKHPQAKLDNKRKKKIKEAFELGYSIDEIRQAIDGCAKTPHNMGQNDRCQIYDDIELILRDSAHIERFMSNANTKATNASSGNSKPEFMEGVI